MTHEELVAKVERLEAEVAFLRKVVVEEVAEKLDEEPDERRAMHERYRARVRAFKERKGA